MHFPFSGKLPCYEESDYSYMLNIMSNFLLVVNASVVTITYGVMDAVYRNEFVAVIKNHFRYIFFLRYCQNNEVPDPNICRLELRRHTIAVHRSPMPGARLT